MHTAYPHPHPHPQAKNYLMKDHRKRSVFSWPKLFFFLVLSLLLLAAFASFAARLCLPGSLQSRLMQKRNIPAMEAKSSKESEAPAAISVGETVIFPDDAVVFLEYPPSPTLFTKDDISCIYFPPNSSLPRLRLTPTATDFDGESRHIVRCPLPPRGMIPSIGVGGDLLAPGPVHRWDYLTYEATIDGSDNTTIVFVKGLDLQSGITADPSKFKCIYGLDLSKPQFVLSDDAVSASQEVIRCRTPLSILNASQKFRRGSADSIKVSVRVFGQRTTVDSIARLKPPPPAGGAKRHKMCVCTMLRNQARFLHEWIAYHRRVGVDRWFIYDNNSSDDLEGVIESLIAADHNVSRHLWPWVKTLEAGLSHCALRARDSCEWVGFIDLDEFFYLHNNLSLYEFVMEQTGAGDNVGEVRIACHNFGPSGLKAVPARGVMIGYTCRLARPERHKSIIRPEALNATLMNLVHHFHLKAGFRHLNINIRKLVINHYKYQVWEVFKEKFHGRPATYVSDWQDEKNLESRDRTPGLGTKAVEPSDWSRRFCEIKDTGLRDRVLESFTDPRTGYLPWEHHQTTTGVKHILRF